MSKIEKKYYLYLFAQLAIVLASIFGSLFFSEVMKYPPCSLCWYQRLCMYPMALIILTGFFLQSRDTVLFLIPFSIAGLFVSAYHNLIYYKFITIIVPCTASAPCTEQQLNWLGFVTIPLLSLLCFIVLFVLNLFTLHLLRKVRIRHEK
jgi:disulfide bond formation protein DsbB